MLKGKRVAAIITDGFHREELLEPVKALREESAEVVIVAHKPEHLTLGVLDHVTVKVPDKLKPAKRLKADKLIYDVKSEEFDALLIPGGSSPEALRRVPEMIEFVKDIYAFGKVIAAICHGVMPMISAGIVKGKNMTCVDTIGIDLQNAGAIYLDKPLVIDGNIVTSRTPVDMEYFIEGIKKVLK